MAMYWDLVERYRRLSDQELLEIWVNRDDYRKEAVQAVQDVLAARKVSLPKIAPIRINEKGAGHNWVLPKLAFLFLAGFGGYLGYEYRRPDTANLPFARSESFSDTKTRFIEERLRIDSLTEVEVLKYMGRPDLVYEGDASQHQRAAGYRERLLV